jgi:NAD(P)-dependent dehydrogenase (short-subunit alcohol dehydrogenase family)
MSEGDSVRSVVITGASTGIGRACALRLDRKGIRVFAGVRTEADAEALQAIASDLLQPVHLDVTDAESIDSAGGAIAGIVRDDGLAGLVNNAGVYFGGPLEFISLEGIRDELEVNFFGAIAVTQALLPLLRKCGGNAEVGGDRSGRGAGRAGVGAGRIVNISSLSGLFAFPFMGPYAASKFALEALSDSWRVELRPWGIHVAVVEPGDIDTPIWDKGFETIRRIRDELPTEALELYGPVFELADKGKQRGISAERVAEVVEHALFARRPKIRYLVGSDAKLASYFFRWLPARLRDWMISRKFPAYP